MKAALAWLPFLIAVSLVAILMIGGERLPYEGRIAVGGALLMMTLVGVAVRLLRNRS